MQDLCNAETFCYRTVTIKDSSGNVARCITSSESFNRQRNNSNGACNIGKRQREKKKTDYEAK